MIILFFAGDHRPRRRGIGGNFNRRLRNMFCVDTDRTHIIYIIINEYDVFYLTRVLNTNFTMNIFLLDVLTAMCASYHCDKHCIKMILETTQLLYTAWWFGRQSLPLPELDTCEFDPYRPTHANHPSAIWARADTGHYHWLLDLGFALCKEYYLRYHKLHKCMSHLERLQSMGAPPAVAEETYIPPAHKMATTGLPKGVRFFHCAIRDDLWEQCAVYTDGQLNAVKTYRKYYMTKPWQLKWHKKSERAPSWYAHEANEAFRPTSLLSQHIPKSTGVDIENGAVPIGVAI